METYADVIFKRLSSLQFISGESTLKADALNRLCSCLTAGLSTDVKQHTIIILRSFVLDWDRVIRASAFRCLRYCIDDTNDEKRLISTSLHKLSISRLEASKSSLERAQIIRFLSRWISISADDQVISFLTKSFLEIVRSQVAVSPVAPFVLCLIDILVCITRRFSGVNCRIGIIRALIDQGLPTVDHVRRAEILSLAILQSGISGIVRIPKIIITPVLLEALLQSPVGTLMAAYSFDGNFMGGSDVLLEQLLILRKEKCLKPLVDSFLAPCKDEIIEGIMGRRKTRYLQLFDDLPLDKMGFTLPEWKRAQVPVSYPNSVLTSRMNSESSAEQTVEDSYYRLELLKASSTFPVNERFQIISSLLSKHMLEEESQLNPLIFAYGLRSVTHLAASEPSLDIALLSTLASIHGLNSELIWLLSFGRDPAALGHAIESAWLEQMWESNWVGENLEALDIFPHIIDQSLTTIFPEGSRQHASEWSVNGTPFRSSLIDRPPLNALVSLKALNSQYIIEIIWNSPLAVPHHVALIDSPTAGIKDPLKVEYGTDCLLVLDISEPIVRASMLTYIYTIGGTQVAEFFDPRSGITLTFQIVNGGNGLNLVAVSKQAEFPEVLSLRKRSFEWLLQSPLAILAVSPSAVDWIVSQRRGDVDLALENLNSPNISLYRRGLYFFGCLLVSGSTYAFGICKALGVFEVLNGILSKLGSEDLKMVLETLNVARFIEISYESSPFEIPLVDTLLEGAEPILDVPTVWTPPIGETSSYSDAFNESHLSILREIDSLASSVHFKQKSASLHSIKENSPRLFLSVPLWLAAMDRLEKGRFNLQSRRVIHSLFIHTFHVRASLETLDNLVSQP